MHSKRKWLIRTLTTKDCLVITEVFLSFLSFRFYCGAVDLKELRHRLLYALSYRKFISPTIDSIQLRINVGIIL